MNRAITRNDRIDDTRQFRLKGLYFIQTIARSMNRERQVLYLRGLIRKGDQDFAAKFPDLVIAELIQRYYANEQDGTCRDSPLGLYKLALVEIGKRGRLTPGR